MPLKNKTIVIVSPQAWGQMFISKHHYAIALAKMGNRVYFLNPPETGGNKKPGQVQISTSCTHHNLFIIDHRLSFPFVFKFHALWLFHWLMRFHVKKILQQLNRQVDIVWSFDQGHLYPFKFFGKKPFKIFQPVDEPPNAEAIRAAEGSQVIFSVTTEILEKYSGFAQPRHLINHGIGDDFLSVPVSGPADKKNIHVGISGNLLREDVDRPTLLKIIAENHAVVFEYWGPFSTANNNIGGSATEETKAFLEELKNLGLLMHGPINQVQLALALQRMDAFLICYDVERDQSRGTNYHKIMEYLSTGKVIIANNVSAYQDKPELLQMVRSRNNNHGLLRLFKEVMQNLRFHNNPGLQEKRKAYARMNTYANQVGRIEKIIGSMAENRKSNVRIV